MHAESLQRIVQAAGSALTKSVGGLLAMNRTIHDFCRVLLSQVMEEVRQHYTPEQIKKVWVWDAGGGRKSFEFHGPNGEYIYNLDADCKWGAVASGWQKLLAQKEEQGMKAIPISAAKQLAEKYEYDQVVVIARAVGKGEHVTTYGKDKQNCDAAAQIGNFLKYKVMGWKPDAETLNEFSTLLDSFIKTQNDLTQEQKQVLVQFLVFVSEKP